METSAEKDNAAAQWRDKIADTNADSFLNGSTVHWTVEFDHKEVVKLLIARDARVE